MAMPRVRYHRCVPGNERIAVVGAGIIGCAVAFQLSRRGADVTLFDGRSLAGGATQASAGILAPYTEAHEGGRLFDLTVRGLADYDDFVRQVRSTSGVVFEYRRSGTLEIAEADHRAGELRARLSEPWAASAALRWLQAEELRLLLPSLDQACVGALHCSIHGHVAVRSFIAAIADAAQRSGARIQLETAVTRIELASDRVRIGVGEQTAAFDRVVLCSGAWTPDIDPLAATAGRIRPVRGQLVRLSSPKQQLRHVVWGSACYIVPWEDGTMLVGATSEEVGFDERATAEGVRGLLAAAEALIPDLRSATFVDVRVGLRPGTADGVPILGPGADPRVIYAAGHFRNGVLLAPLTGRLIANYVFDNTVDPAFSAT
jgi:glycine oxidase